MVSSTESGSTLLRNPSVWSWSPENDSLSKSLHWSLDRLFQKSITNTNETNQILTRNPETGVAELLSHSFKVLRAGIPIVQTRRCIFHVVLLHSFGHFNLIPIRTSALPSNYIRSQAKHLLHQPEKLFAREPLICESTGVWIEASRTNCDRLPRISEISPASQLIKTLR